MNKKKMPRKANRNQFVNADEKWGLDSYNELSQMVDTYFEEYVKHTKEWESLSEEGKAFNESLLTEEMIFADRHLTGREPQNTYSERCPKLIISKSLERAAYEGCQFDGEPTVPGKMLHLFNIYTICEEILKQRNPFFKDDILAPFEEIHDSIENLPDDLCCSLNVLNDLNALAKRFDDSINRIREIFKDMPKWIDGYGSIDVLYSTSVKSLATELAAMPRESKIQ